MTTQTVIITGGATGLGYAIAEGGTNLSRKKSSGQRIGLLRLGRASSTLNGRLIFRFMLFPNLSSTN